MVNFSKFDEYYDCTSQRSPTNPNHKIFEESNTKTLHNQIV